MRTTALLLSLLVVALPTFSSSPLEEPLSTLKPYFIHPLAHPNFDRVSALEPSWGEDILEPGELPPTVVLVSLLRKYPSTRTSLHPQTTLSRDFVVLSTHPGLLLPYSPSCLTALLPESWFNVKVGTSVIRERVYRVRTDRVEINPHLEAAVILRLLQRNVAAAYFHPGLRLDTAGARRRILKILSDYPSHQLFGLASHDVTQLLSEGPAGSDLAREDTWPPHVVPGGDGETLEWRGNSGRQRGLLLPLISPDLLVVRPSPLTLRLFELVTVNALTRPSDSLFRVLNEALDVLGMKINGPNMDTLKVLYPGQFGISKADGA